MRKHLIQDRKNAFTPTSYLGIPPDFLCIGFFCHDLYQNDYLLGGTASYASLMAKELNKRTAVLTSVGTDFKYTELFEQQGIEICNKPAKKTTVFHNIYQADERQQYLYERAQNLSPDDLPDVWKKAPLVLYCPIANEVDFSLLTAFPNALLGATIQGWLRHWDTKGKISPKAMDWTQLKVLDVIIMSDEDILGYESVFPEIIENVPLVVLTKGANGAIIFSQNEVHDFPVFPVRVVDPTGAGDIFAASFLIKYQETQNIASAVAFAHAAASLIVEKVGIQIPSVAEVEARFQRYCTNVMQISNP